MSQSPRNMSKRKAVPLLYPGIPREPESPREAKLRKVMAKLNGGPRSCHSDNASTSSFGETSIDDQPASFDLEASFPSMFVPLRLMRSVAAAGNFQAFPPLVGVFARCVKTVLESLHQLSWEVRLNPCYKVGQHSLYCTLDVFECHARDMARSSPTKAYEALRTAVELLDSTMEGLTGFLTLAENLILDCEPVLVAPEDLCEETIMSPKKTLKRGALARILRRASKPPVGKTAISSTSTSSSSDEDSVRAPIAPRERTTKKRFSLLIFPDPEHLDVQVTLPTPSDDNLSCTFTAEGQISGASLRTLLRIVTSKEAVTDYELTQIVLTSFRFFSDPLEFFQGLVARYEEIPSAPLNTAQQRVWDVESKHVKLRVAKILLLWLEFHWRHETDVVIFTPLSDFCTQRMALDLPTSLCEKIFKSLSKCNQPEHGGWKLRRRAEIILDKPLRQRPASFEIRIGVPISLMLFQNREGQTELARQLTLAIVKQYKTVDPMDALVFWHTGQGPDVGRKLTAIFAYERSVSLWITRSILGLETPKERATLVGIFIGVAWQCVKLRNFASALSIYNALCRSCITRLRDTNAEITEYHRKKYKKLVELFPSGNDWRIYRAALQSSEEPAVPPFAVLIRDVDHASEKMKGLIQLEKDTGMWVLNINRYRILANTVQNMEMIHIPYNITSLDRVQDWLFTETEPFKNYSNESEEACMQEWSLRSRTLEARNAKQALPSWKRKIDRMISRDKVELPPWCKV